MGFWEHQVLELTRSIDALLQETAAPSPASLSAQPWRSGDTVVPVELGGWSGPGAQAATQLSDEITHLNASRAAADQHLEHVLRGGHEASQHLQTRLRGLRSEILDGVHARAHSLDAPGGQIEMAHFLNGKAGALLAVIRQADEHAATHSAALGAHTAAYNGVNEPRDN
ncbi:DUF4226 domain-containing protein [Mycobacterium sp. TY813]|uniref:DUF4226 domain-containing protein n=1 Tax=Mycobacterium TaxID=1763 RepID=UPI0027420E69|nr:DUF4226 domain-containing protein [Mycobacterium sp. TY813]MDP7732890.1 DUF4226 domain-containing protein [Mycobacterium sp. TY813]